MKPEQLKDLPVAAISVRHTPQQPRTEFDEAEIQELSTSLQQQGLIHRIVVRPKPGGRNGQYELVSGERRLRAAKLADWDTIPTSIRAYTDEEVDDIQLTENLQRVNLKPLEEAQYIARMMQQRAVPLAEVSLKLGKPVRYVEKRLALLQLVPEAQEHLRTGLLPLTAAHVVATLPVGDQQKALRFLIQQATPFDGAAGGQAAVAYCRSEQELKQFLNRDVLHRLADAPFPTADLIPGLSLGRIVSPVCTICPMRTSATPDLFGAVMPDDRCLNSGCWKIKTAGYWADIAAKAEKKYGGPVPFLATGYSLPAAPPRVRTDRDEYGLGAVRWLEPGATFCENATPFIRISDQPPVVMPACTDPTCECRQRLRPDELPKRREEDREYYPAELLPQLQQRVAGRLAAQYERSYVATTVSEALGFDLDPAAAWRALCWQLAEGFDRHHAVLATVLGRFGVALLDPQGRALTGEESNWNLWNDKGRRVYELVQGWPAERLQALVWTMTVALVGLGGSGANYRADTRLPDLAQAMLRTTEAEQEMALASAHAEAEHLMRDSTVFEVVPGQDGRNVSHANVWKYGLGFTAEWLQQQPLHILPPVLPDTYPRPDAYNAVPLTEPEGYAEQPAKSPENIPQTV